MTLRLKVVSPQAASLGPLDTQLFGVNGGTIGRAPDNDWVLPDPERYVSGHHARIEHRDGRYWITDISSNGTFLNEAKQSLAERGGPYALNAGDRLKIGDFEIVASFDEDLPDPGSGDTDAIVAYDGLSSAPEIKHLTEEDLGESLNLSALLGSRDESGSNLSLSDSSSQPMAPVNAWGQVIPEAAIAPKTPTRPRPSQNSPQIPWNLATRRMDPQRTPRKEPLGREPLATASSEIAASTDLSGLQALCRGAGIDPVSLPASVQPLVLQLAGQLLREVILGLMDALQARTEIRARYRIPQPAIQPSENNPLQFSAGVEEALRKLFEAQGKTAQSSRYLGPVEAVRESFHEMKAHHQSMLSAMHTAFTEFLGQMHPQELQERFDRGLKRSGLLAATNKTKYWELYAELYQTLSQAPKGELPHLFVEEFGKAYEAKLRELTTRRPRAPGGDAS